MMKNEYLALCLSWADWSGGGVLFDSTGVTGEEGKEIV